MSFRSSDAAFWCLWVACLIAILLATSIADDLADLRLTVARDYQRRAPAESWEPPPVKVIIVSEKEGEGCL